MLTPGIVLNVEWLLEELTQLIQILHSRVIANQELLDFMLGYRNREYKEEPIPHFLVEIAVKRRKKENAKKKKIEDRRKNDWDNYARSLPSDERRFCQQLLRKYHHIGPCIQNMVTALEEKTTADNAIHIIITGCKALKDEIDFWSQIGTSFTMKHASTRISVDRNRFSLLVNRIFSLTKQLEKMYTEQKEEKRMFNGILKEPLAELKPPFVAPKKIHQIWIGSASRSLPLKYYRNTLSLGARSGKAYERNIWTYNPNVLSKAPIYFYDTEVASRIRVRDIEKELYPHINRIFEKTVADKIFQLIRLETIGLPNYAMISDLLRIIILNIPEEGGWYVDTDIYAENSLLNRKDEFFRNTTFPYASLFPVTRYLAPFFDPDFYDGQAEKRAFIYQMSLTAIRAFGNERFLNATRKDILDSLEKKFDANLYLDALSFIWSDLINMVEKISKPNRNIYWQKNPLFYKGNDPSSFFNLLNSLFEMHYFSSEAIKLLTKYTMGFFVGIFKTKLSYFNFSLPTTNTALCHIYNVNSFIGSVPNNPSLVEAISAILINYELLFYQTPLDSKWYWLSPERHMLQSKQALLTSLSMHAVYRTDKNLVHKEGDASGGGATDMPYRKSLTIKTSLTPLISVTKESKNGDGYLKSPGINIYGSDLTWIQSNPDPYDFDDNNLIRLTKKPNKGLCSVLFAPVKPEKGYGQDLLLLNDPYFDVDTHTNIDLNVDRKGAVNVKISVVEFSIFSTTNITKTGANSQNNNSAMECKI